MSFKYELFKSLNKKIKQNIFFNCRNLLVVTDQVNLNQLKLTLC